MTESQLSLSEYLSTVQEVIKLAFDDPVWVRAEIRNRWCFKKYAETKQVEF